MEFEKIAVEEEEYNQIIDQLTISATALDMERCKTLSKRLVEMKPKVELYQRYKKIVGKIEEESQLLNDPEMNAMAQEEIALLEAEKSKVAEGLNALINPVVVEKSGEKQNIILEIRSGTGGEESAIFASDLFRMYSKYAQNQQWKLEVMSFNPTGIGGFKEIVFAIEGRDTYNKLRYESGIHRVQRVPITEASGRIHTSAATVAVLIEPKPIEVEISREDLRIDTFRASGCGGQHLNVTDSAIRITHLPTGIVVTCQDERSQIKNKDKAMRVLRARILSVSKAMQHQELATIRKTQVGSGDRSGKIRTYNFPQNRITDHRIGLTLHKLDAIMDGELNELIDALDDSFSGN